MPQSSHAGDFCDCQSLPESSLDPQGHDGLYPRPARSESSSDFQGHDGIFSRPIRSNSSSSSTTFRSVLSFDPSAPIDTGDSTPHHTTPVADNCIKKCAAYFRSRWARGASRITRGCSRSEPMLGDPEPETAVATAVTAGLPAILGVVDEDEEVIAIDGNPAGLQRWLEALIHNMAMYSYEEYEQLLEGLKMPYESLSVFSSGFRQCVRARTTANDFRQMMSILESIFNPLRATLNKVMDIFMNQWVVKIRPVAMNFASYKGFNKKQREAVRSALDEEEHENIQKYELQYRNCKLRYLMDNDNDPAVVRSDGSPLSSQAVNWTKGIIEFMCSIFNLYLRVCPDSANSITDYLAHVDATGVHRSLPPPHQIFSDSNLHNALPMFMRIMVKQLLRATKIGPKEIFNSSMKEVFGDSIPVVRTFRDNLRAIACLLDIMLEE